jgi:superfamily II DNA or RNA helicase
MTCIAPSLFDLAPQPAKAPPAPLAGRGIPLRHPQRQDVDALMYALESGHKHPACVAATGYGKGALIAETAGRLMPNGKVVCLVDREHLVYQLADEIERHLRIDVGRVADGKCTGLTFPVVVSTVQAMFTAGRDGRPLYEYPQFRGTRAVLADESHKFFAPCFRSVPGFFVQQCGAVVVGFTATPVASNGDRWRDFFDWTPAAPGPCMRTVGWCIDNGYLVPLRQAFIRIDLRLDELYGQLDGADDEADDGDGSRAGSSIIMDLLTDKGEQAAARFASGVVEAIGDRHSMVFTPPRTRGNPMMPAKVVASWLNAAGLPSDAVWGNRPDKAAVLARFVRGRPQALTNCSLLTEGFNAPSVSAAFICRLVKSWRLVTQMIGRAMRPAPECIADLNRLDSPDDAAARRAVIAASGKPDALIADLVGLDGKILRASAIDVLYADESQDVRDEMARRVFAKPKARPDDDAPAVNDAERDAARDALARRQSEQLAEMARRRAMRGGLPADVSITYGDGGREALPAVPVPRQQATLGERAVFVAMAVAATRYSPADAKLIADTKPRNQVRGMTWGYKKKLDKERARPNWNAARLVYPDWSPAA